jgi:malonyl CoA-acyl carrier protein transacylase
MKTFIFPGQGSQSTGMGGTLFDQFKELTATADSILGYSIKELCLDDSANNLNKTQFTQPALYVVNALSYLKKVEESGKAPDFLAGHSLGEFNALLAAECFDFATGLRLVARRGALMSRVLDGAMAAILNATQEEIATILRQNDLTGIDIANYNTPAQIVISGRADEIIRAQPFFQKGKIRYYPLNTSGAFHSRFMRTARDEFQDYLQTFRFAAPKVPVIANVTARPYRNDGILQVLANQIASTVKWSESIQYLMAQGLRHGAVMEFEEVGYGDVLTRMLYTIKQQTPDSALVPYLKEEQQARPDAVAEKPTEAQRSSADAPVKPANAAQKMAAWNSKYPIGTKVTSAVASYQSLETRTQAVVLFGHRAAVYMKGYNGYFDLDELAAA